jgi:hypothetical protein
MKLTDLKTLISGKRAGSYSNNQLDQLRYKFKGATEIRKNYAQAYQDMFVLSMLNGKKNGTFLEIGAFEAVFISNTYLLESEFSWKGISVDVEASAEESFRKKGRTSQFILQDALTIDYEKVFKQNGFGRQIDYLQLDIEPQAQTLRCLKKVPLDKYRFSVITYETDYCDPTVNRRESKKNRDESRKVLSSYGYEMIVGNICNTSRDDPFEDWYVDPKVIDKKIIKLFKASPEYNNTAENYMLAV